MCPSCGAPNTIVATRALTRAEAHIEHDSALLARTSPSSVGRPSSRAASRMSAISACAVGSPVVAWAFARLQQHASVGRREHRPERRVAARRGDRCLRHRTPDERLGDLLLHRPIVAGVSRARCGPRSPRRGRGRATRRAGRRSGAATSCRRSGCRRTSAQHLQHRRPDGREPLGRLRVALDAHRAGVAAVRPGDVLDDLRPVAPAAAGPLAERLGRLVGDRVEHVPRGLDDRREPLASRASTGVAVLGRDDATGSRRPSPRRPRSGSTTSMSKSCGSNRSPALRATFA